MFTEIDTISLACGLAFAALASCYVALRERYEERAKRRQPVRASGSRRPSRVRHARRDRGLRMAS